MRIVRVITHQFLDSEEKEKFVVRCSTVISIYVHCDLYLCSRSKSLFTVVSIYGKLPI